MQRFAVTTNEPHKSDKYCFCYTWRRTHTQKGVNRKFCPDEHRGVDLVSFFLAPWGTRALHWGIMRANSSKRPIYRLRRKNHMPEASGKGPTWFWWCCWDCTDISVALKAAGEDELTLVVGRRVISFQLLLISFSTTPQLGTGQIEAGKTVGEWGMHMPCREAKGNNIELKLNKSCLESM